MQVGSAELRGAKDGQRARTNCPSTLSTVHTVLAATIIIAFLSCLYYSTRHNMTSTRAHMLESINFALMDRHGVVKYPIFARKFSKNDSGSISDLFFLRSLTDRRHLLPQQVTMEHES